MYCALFCVASYTFGVDSWWIKRDRKEGGTRPVGLPTLSLTITSATITTSGFKTCQTCQKPLSLPLPLSRRIWLHQKEFDKKNPVLCCAFCAVLCFLCCAVLSFVNYLKNLTLQYLTIVFTIPHHCQEEFVYIKIGFDIRNHLTSDIIWLHQQPFDFISNHLTSSEIIWHQKSLCHLSFTRKLANWVDIMATKGCPHIGLIVWIKCTKSCRKRDCACTV